MDSDNFVLDFSGDEINKGIERALAQDDRAPRIENGYWYEWRIDKFVNTGVKAPGPQGEPGRAATVKINTVTTLEPDEAAFVTNVGTSLDASFNFGIPRGKSLTDIEELDDVIELLSGADGNIQAQINGIKELINTLHQVFDTIIVRDTFALLNAVPNPQNGYVGIVTRDERYSGSVTMNIFSQGNWAFIAELSTDVSEVLKFIEEQEAINELIQQNLSNLNKDKLDLSGGKMTGTLVAGGTQDIATPQVRNIVASPIDLTPGVTPLATGTLYLVYEV